MATIRTTYKFKCDLDKGTLETTLRNSLMQADALADAFAVTVQRNGADVDISGMTVYGYLYASSTKTTVPLRGTVSGSTATVILSEDCYAVPGYASLMIQLHDGDVRHTVLKVDFVVTRTGGTLVLDGDNILPTLAELLGQISAMEQATAEARAATDVANQAVENVEAFKGEIHGDITALTEDIGKHNGKYTVDYFDENSLTDGYVRNGVVTAASGWKCTDYIPCKYGDEVSLAMTTGADLNAVCVYDANKDFIANMTYSEIGSARSPWTFYMTFINCAYIRYNVVPVSVLSYADQYCKVEDAAKYRDTLKEALYNHQTIYYVRSDVATNPSLQTRPNHFATLKECTEYIQTNAVENAIVHVYGTQDLVEQFGTDYLDSIASDSNVGFGLKIGNNTHFIFYEGAKVLFNYSGENSDCTHYFSPFNVYGSFTLENATIECSNCRYCVHEDVPTSADSVPGWYTAKYINCVMTHNGNTESFDDSLPVCIGGGTNRNSLSIVEGGQYTCPGTAPLAIAYHNFNTASYGNHPSRVVIRNAWVSNGIRLGEFSDSTVNVEISGCYIPSGYTTGTTHFDIKAWNNATD